MRLEGPDLRSGRPDLRPDSLDLRPDRPDEPDLRPDGPDGRGRTNTRMDERTKVPLCFTGLRPLQDHCPKLENCLIPQTFVLTSKAGYTAAPVA